MISNSILSTITTNATAAATTVEGEEESSPSISNNTAAAILPITGSNGNRRGSFMIPFYSIY